MSEESEDEVGSRRRAALFVRKSPLEKWPILARLVVAYVNETDFGALVGLFWLSRNSRENRTSFRGRPNISNGLARRESEF
jgi:hypothetical protein